MTQPHDITFSRRCLQQLFEDPNTLTTVLFARAQMCHVPWRSINLLLVVGVVAEMTSSPISLLSMSDEEAPPWTRRTLTSHPRDESSNVAATSTTELEVQHGKVETSISSSR